MKLLIALLLFLLLTPVVYAAPRPRVVMRHELRMARVQSGVAMERAQARRYFWGTAFNVTSAFRPITWILP